MRLIKRHVLGAIRGKLDDRVGIFDFLGLDFMVDTDLNVWLIEVNVNPALHTNCNALRSVIPASIDSSVDIILEVSSNLFALRSTPPSTHMRTQDYAMARLQWYLSYCRLPGKKSE